MKGLMSRHWYQKLWIWPVVYFSLGFFNILFAWLGMIDFLVPLVISIFAGSKSFCNKYCGRGHLYMLLGERLGMSRRRPTPGWMYSKWFRYGFLIFFMAMFVIMVINTYLVASGAESLKEAVKLFWSFDVPWKWAYSGSLVPEWVAQYSFGFYGLMVTSLLLGLVAMLLYKPRSWCAMCPMGTMTQGVCRIRAAAKGR